jgi:hypothetical protein
VPAWAVRDQALLPGPRVAKREPDESLSSGATAEYREVRCSGGYKPCRDTGTVSAMDEDAKRDRSRCVCG